MKTRSYSPVRAFAFLAAVLTLRAALAESVIAPRIRVVEMSTPGAQSAWQARWAGIRGREPVAPPAFSSRGKAKGAARERPFCNCEYLRGNAVSDKRPSAVGCRGCARGLVMLVTALLAGRDGKYKCIFFHPKHPLMVRPRLCLPRQKAERCSFSATSEGGCYEVPKGIEIQV